MKLSIITINYKKPQLTARCMASLYKEYKTFFENNEFELIIVDNASGDDSVNLLNKEIVKNSYKNMSVVAHTENNGFGGGNNFGVAHATGDYMLFLNNDTVVGKGLNNMLFHLVDHPEIGILGGQLKNMDGSLQSSVGQFYFLPYVFLLMLGMERFEFLETSPDEITKVDWVKGACMMMRKDLFNTLKGFDEKIFMYTEDMELCYRAHLIGKDSYFFPQIDIRHEDQGSSSRAFAIVQIYKGIIYFYKKHRSFLELQIVKLLLLTKASLLLLYGRLAKNEYFVTTYEKALSATR